MGQEIQKSILIADDAADLRHIYKRILQRDHYCIFEAEDGLDALTKLQELHPDLILLDHRMPHMNGSDVYRAIKRLGLEVKVILITAAQDVDGIAQSLGIKDFLGKPIGMDDLRKSVQQILGKPG